jgi:hypothetical protein
MKLKNWKFVSTIGTIALAGIVAIPTLTLTSCSGGSSTPTKINIYGTTDIHGSLQDSAQLNAVDNIGNDVTQGS